MLKNNIYSFYDKNINITIEKTKNDVYQKNKKDIVKEAFEKMQEEIKMCGFKSEEEKARYEAKINEKIRLGEKLSPAEMNYIQRTNPSLYMRVKRIQMQRELLEKKLKQCKSKEEVEEVYNQAIASIDKKDPDRVLVAKNYENATKEFKKTREYQSLPRTIKDNEYKKVFYKDQ